MPVTCRNFRSPTTGRLSFASLLGALPIIVAWVYFVGRTYLESYYVAFGTDYSFIRPDLNDALLFGVMSQLGFAFGYLLLILVLLVILLVATFLTYLAAAVLRGNWAVAASLLRNVLFPQRWGDASASPTSRGDPPRVSLNFETVFGSIGALGLSVGLANEVGDHAALTKMASWASGETIEWREVRYVEGEVTHAFGGQLIGCGEAACAFWTDAHVFQLPRSSIVSVRSAPPSDSVGR